MNGASTAPKGIDLLKAIFYFLNLLYPSLSFSSYARKTTLRHLPSTQALKALVDPMITSHCINVLLIERAEVRLLPGALIFDSHNTCTCTPQRSFESIFSWYRFPCFSATILCTEGTPPSHHPALVLVDAQGLSTFKA